jgi:hypothetical protein
VPFYRGFSGSALTSIKAAAASSGSLAYREIRHPTLTQIKVWYRRHLHIRAQ